jgi:hypothetical protein
LFGVLSKIGLYAFLSLLPLIIVYLIKPKPKKMKVPSLMFFIKQSKKKNKNFFSRLLFKDWLFIIQLIILILLCLTLIRPFFVVDHDITAKNTVIVLDVSASMQTHESGTSRFDLAIDKALNSLGSKNTLVLASNTPRIVLNSESKGGTEKFLKNLEPLDTSSNLAEAILMGGELIVGKDGRVIVISDFIDTSNNDPFVAKSVLESKSVVVDFIKIGTLRKNVGITNLNLGEDYSSLTIKNFNEEDAFVEVNLNEQKVEMNVPAESVKSFTFKTPAGKTEIKLVVEEGKDDFFVDNLVYVSTPNIEKINLLLINNGVSKYLYNALKAIPKVNVELSEPPIIKEGDYDVYILQNIDEAEFLVGTYEELVASGKNVIVYAQSDLVEQNYYGALPIQVDGIGDEPAQLEMETVLPIAEDVSFGGLNYYFKTIAKEGVLTFLSVAGSPVVVFDKNVMFYGILDAHSDFKVSPSYPIFWSNVLDHLMDIKDLAVLNKNSGTTLFLENVANVKTPTGFLQTKQLSLEEIGFYEVNGDVLGINLLDDLESDVNFIGEGNFEGDVTLNPIKEKRNFEISLILIYILLALLIFELVYTKLRGEI